MDTLELIRRSQQGDKEAREQMILDNVGLVWSIVRRFSGRGCEMEDLFQIGSIGLIKAIDKFDLSYEVKFSTYAVPMISGEIKRFLRDDGMVKVSRTLKENGWKVKQTAETLSQELGREATLPEISERSGLSIEEIVMAMEANVEVESIYRSVYQSDGSEVYLVDQVVGGSGTVGRPAGGADTGDEMIGNSRNLAGACEDFEKEKVLNHMLLVQLLGELGEKERELISLRYFQDKTQVEVAKHLGISQVQVSRLEKRILLRMRERLAG